jgi:hypothetical protein
MGKFKDLIGQVFGRLTVIEQKGRTNQNNVKWLCRCVCGTEKVVANYHLLRGSTKSCGCLVLDLSFNNLTGKIFGNLTVIELYERGDGKVTTWRCKCSCGNYKVIAAHSLISGLTKSCGCLVSPNITGSTFGRLTVLERGKTKGGYWLCECICGKQLEVRTTSLNNGTTRSCGCLALELISTKGGRSKEYAAKSWYSMLDRCNNPNNPEYLSYGGRGITVCSRWMNSLEDFLRDMGDRPEGMSLDRIDVNGNYEPSNCRWASDKEQARNKRNTLYLTYLGKTLSLAEWAEELETPYPTIAARYKKGWTVEECFFGKKGNDVYLFYKNQHLPISEWSTRLEVKKHTIYNRYRKGWSSEECLFGRSKKPPIE